MRVLQIANNDLSGGAAIAAYRLHLGLNRAGHDCRMLVRDKHSDDDRVRRFELPQDPWAKLVRRVRDRRLNRVGGELRRLLVPGHDMVTGCVDSDGRALLQQVGGVDVINLHWVTGLLDHATFFPAAAARRWPVVWTLHDMNPLTGGCHYSAGCERFVDRCGACPLLTMGMEDDYTRRFWRIKRRSLQHMDPSRMRIVTPSRWLAGEARRSSLLDRFDVEVIPNGIDVDQFKPIDRAQARAELGLPMRRPIVLFITAQANYPRKGHDLIVEALRKLDLAGAPLLVSIGGDEAELGADRHVSLGRIDDASQLTAAYSAADVFVVPSRQDNLPNTILESMACGTAVVGFEIGGIPDLVREGETGALAAPEDAGSLCAAIERVLADEAKRDVMGRACRAYAERDLSLDTQARRYAGLYQQLVGETETARQGA